MGRSTTAHAKPVFVDPMAALAVSKLPEGDEWLYELKLDGYRVVALKDGDTVRLISRKGHELTRDYPEVVECVRNVHARTAVLDGEVVALDEKGRPSFQMLQHRASFGKGKPVVYYAFDLLHLNGRDLRELPLEERRERLATVIKDSCVLFSVDFPGETAALIEEIKRLKLEGLIAKRRGSRYEAGKRSGAWQKFKIQNEQEFVIGGYRPDSRNFDALLVGYYQGKQLMFAGKVRAGFTPALRASLWKRMKPVETPKCPFTNLPNSKKGHWDEGVTAEEMTTLHWLRPKLVAVVRFTEWTAGGLLRHSSFVALRDDKDPKEIVREQARSAYS